MNNEPEIEVSADHSEALLQSTIERLRARGDARRFACMGLPAPIFNDLCGRLLNRAIPVRKTAEWLAGQMPDAPTRSSVERFAEALFDEFRLVELEHQMRQAQRFTETASSDEADALQMSLNQRVTQLLAGELMRAQSGEAIETKRLVSLFNGARSVARTALDKRKLDAQLEALQKQIQERDIQIRLKEQRLIEMQREFERGLKALENKARTTTRAITQQDIDEVRQAVFGPSSIYAAIREELTRPSDAAGKAAPSSPGKPVATGAASGPSPDPVAPQAT